MHRRVFLKNGAIAMFGAGVAPAWLARAASSSTRRKVLVVVFQRGAVDGLNVVVPHGDPHYYEFRPRLAVAKSDLVDLDGFFGLHPSLLPLEKVWKAGHLAIVHASGSPDPTRSHFDAQDFMESGTPGRKSTADGWLNRILPAHAASPVQAVAMGPTLPRAMRGARPSVAVAAVPKFRLRDGATAAAFEQMYGSDRSLSAAARDTFDAMKLLASVPDSPPAAGIHYPQTPLGRNLRQIAQIIRAGIGLEVAFADQGGWDTHVNEAPQLKVLLAGFGQALAAFHDDLGDRLEDVTVVTLSEFGRTVRENGTGGTDHGHANVMFAFGGAVQGGKVYGEWPGLAPDQLYEGRDLALTTDFRDVLGEVVSTHLGVKDLPRVFPGYQPRFRNLIRA